jgi:hypothetical protein
MMDALGGPTLSGSYVSCAGMEERHVDQEIQVTGAIVDSWVERAHIAGTGSRLVLQVAPSGHPKELMIVEAEAALVPDRGWLQDLGENLCHGLPVSAVGRLNLSGFFSATEIRLCH